MARRYLFMAMREERHSNVPPRGWCLQKTLGVCRISSKSLAATKTEPLASIADNRSAQRYSERERSRHGLETTANENLRRSSCTRA